MKSKPDTEKLRRPGRPRKEDQSTPDIKQLIQSAAPLFAREGYDGVSMRKLSKELGVSYSLFHHYFDSKAALWRSVVDSSAGAIVKQVQHEISTLPPAENSLDHLKVVLRIYVESSIKHPDFYQIALQETLIKGPRLDYIYEHYMGPILKAQTEIINQIIASKKAKPTSPIVLFSLMQSASMLIMQRPLYELMGAKKKLTKKEIAAHVDSIIDIIFHGWLFHE